MRVEEVPFLKRFLARVRQSADADRPSVPEGTGDVHWNPADAELALPNAAGTAWIVYTLGTPGGSFDLGDLNDVDTTGQAAGDVLGFNGTTWVPVTAGTDFNNLLRVNDTDQPQETAINFLNGFAVAITGTDDAGNSETEIAVAVVPATINPIDDYENLPAAATAGRLFFSNTGYHLLRDSGSVWKSVGLVDPVWLPPDPDGTDWLGRTQSATIGSIRDIGSHLLIFDATSYPQTTTALNAVTRANANGLSILAEISRQFTPATTQEWYAGICVRDSASNDWRTLGIYRKPDNSVLLEARSYTDQTTVATTPLSEAVPYDPNARYWFEVEDNAGDVVMRIGKVLGRPFINTPFSLIEHTFTSFTFDEVGVFADIDSTDDTFPVAVLLHSWYEI